MDESNANANNNDSGNISTPKGQSLESNVNNGRRTSSANANVMNEQQQLSSRSLRIPKEKVSSASYQTSRSTGSTFVDYTDDFENDDEDEQDQDQDEGGIVDNESMSTNFGSFNSNYDVNEGKVLEEDDEYDEEVVDHGVQIEEIISARRVSHRSSRVCTPIQYAPAGKQSQSFKMPPVLTRIPKRIYGNPQLPQRVGSGGKIKKVVVRSPRDPYRQSNELFYGSKPKLVPRVRKTELNLIEHPQQVSGPAAHRLNCAMPNAGKKKRYPYTMKPSQTFLPSTMSCAAMQQQQKRPANLNNVKSSGYGYGYTNTSRVSNQKILNSRLIQDEEYELDHFSEEQERRLTAETTTASFTLQLHQRSDARREAQNKLRKLSPKLPVGYPYKVNGYAANGIVRRCVVSARRVQIKDLNSRIRYLEGMIDEMKHENRTLKTVHQRQDVALKKYEGVDADLPKLIRKHNNDIHYLQSNLRKSYGSCRDYEDKLRAMNAKVLKLETENYNLQQLAAKNNLDERNELTTKLNAMGHHIDGLKRRLEERERYIEVLAKNHHHQIEVEIGKLRCSHKKLFDARKEIKRVREDVRKKEQIINYLRMRCSREMECEPPMVKQMYYQLDEEAAHGGDGRVGTYRIQTASDEEFEPHQPDMRVRNRNIPVAANVKQQQKVIFRPSEQLEQQHYVDKYPERPRRRVYDNYHESNNHNQQYQQSNSNNKVQQRGAEKIINNPKSQFISNQSQSTKRNINMPIVSQNTLAHGDCHPQKQRPVAMFNETKSNKSSRMTRTNSTRNDTYSADIEYETSQMSYVEDDYENSGGAQTRYDSFYLADENKGNENGNNDDYNDNYDSSQDTASYHSSSRKSLYLDAIDSSCNVSSASGSTRRRKEMNSVGRFPNRDEDEVDEVDFRSTIGDCVQVPKTISKKLGRDRGQNSSHYASLSGHRRNNQRFFVGEAGDCGPDEMISDQGPKDDAPVKNHPTNPTNKFNSNRSRKPSEKDTFSEINLSSSVQRKGKLTKTKTRTQPKEIDEESSRQSAALDSVIKSTLGEPFQVPNVVVNLEEIGKTMKLVQQIEDKISACSTSDSDVTLNDEDETVESELQKTTKSGTANSSYQPKKELVNKVCSSTLNDDEDFANRILQSIKKSDASSIKDQIKIDSNDNGNESHRKEEKPFNFSELFGNVTNTKPIKSEEEEAKEDKPQFDLAYIFQGKGTNGNPSSIAKTEQKVEHQSAPLPSFLQGGTPLAKNLSFLSTALKNVSSTTKSLLNSTLSKNGTGSSNKNEAKR